MLCQRRQFLKSAVWAAAAPIFAQNLTRAIDESDPGNLKLCHRLVKIPTQPDHSSLNLGHTVSILLYELVGRRQTTELGGKPRQLTHLDENLLGHKTLGKVEEIKVKSSADGREIQAWIVRPPRFAEAPRRRLGG